MSHFLGDREPFSNNPLLCQRRYLRKDETSLEKAKRLVLTRMVQDFAAKLLKEVSRQNQVLGDAVDDLRMGPNQLINGPPKTDIERLIRATHRVLNHTIQPQGTSYQWFQHNSQRSFWSSATLDRATQEWASVQREMIDHLVGKKLLKKNGSIFV